MIRTLLTDLLTTAVAALQASGALPPAEYGAPEIAETKNPEHGDFACAFALTAAKKAGMNPRAIAEALAAALGESDMIAAVEIAGPGFLNIRLDHAWLGSLAASIAPGFERSVCAAPLKLNVEFVSVNPNGPITVGSGRGAAFGDTLCRVLEAVGHHVHREFYVNDGVNSEQMRLFAESVRHYVLLASGMASGFPAEGYKGDYVQEVADDVLALHPDAAREDVDWFQRQSQELMIARQQKDLYDFDVVFDTWFREQSLHEADAVGVALAKLKADGVSYEKDGALWLRSTAYGDDKDRVLVRADGRPTYIASDIAYHENKFARGFDKLIDIWSPDHHGYIGRMNAAVAAAGHKPEQFEVVIFQIVRFVKEGQPAPMRKRDGNIYSLRDLMDEIGAQEPPRTSGGEGVGGEGSDAASVSRDTATPTDEVLHELGFTGERERLEAFAAKRRIPFVDLERHKIEGEAISAVPERVARKHAVVPVKKDGLNLWLAMSNTNNIQAMDDVRTVSGCRVYPVMAVPSQIDVAITKYYGASEEVGDPSPPAPSPPEVRGGSDARTRGRDVARFFYLMRSHDTHMDFDIDLATKQSDENPVFYAQYAHARICSVIAKAAEAGLAADPSKANLLVDPREGALIKKILDLPHEVRRCADDYGVHRLTTYAVELARTYHHFYDACRVIQPEEPALSAARLTLCQAARTGLQAVFGLLGISAPERM